MHRIVIVGGGAGGLELATRLGDKLGKSGRVHVTLVDRCTSHIWKPLLHEVATGILDTHTHKIEYAAQAHWHHFEFVQGELVDLARASRRLTLAPVLDSETMSREILPGRCIGYDTLVLALGSHTHFFGVKGAQTHAVTLDTVEQAERLRLRLLDTCLQSRMRANAGPSERVQVAIIGAGATGVELAAELRRMEKELRQFGLHSSADGSNISVTILEAGPRILPALPPEVSEAINRLLEKLGIEVSVGDPVVEVCSQEVKTRAGRVFPTDITIWAAGIKAPECLSSLDGIAVNRINQVKVTLTLQSESDPDVFAMGDCASCPWTEDKMVPPRAQAAHQQALFLAHALRARIEGRLMGTFNYSDHGSLISLGPISAIGSLTEGIVGKKILVRGLIAQVMYAALYRKHLVAVSGWRRMIATAVVHALRRFTSPRVKLH